jgi:two-component system KDP operon response regulator KdpE
MSETEAAKVLVVDDEPQITKVLRASLMAEGYSVRAATDGIAALDLFRAWSPDLVVTDLSMPEMNGVELCRTLRAASDVPILVLSVTHEEEKKIEALDAGADDYVTKPFSIDELLARVRAGLRRWRSASDSRKIIVVGDFRLDLDGRRVFVRGQEVHLTPKEFDLLAFFAKNPGRILTRRALLVEVWGHAYADQGESVRVFVSQLRRKIELDPSNPRYLVNEPWVGYRFDPGEPA